MRRVREAFAASLGFMKLKHVEYMAALGVPRELATRCGPRPLWSAAPILTDAAGTFQVAEHGPHAVIMPVGLPGPNGWYVLTDLVAFFPEAPLCWWLLTGAGVLLGEDTVEDAARGVPLRLLSTPLGWLQASGNGAVVLRWDILNPRTAFLGVERIECDTPALATRLAVRVAECSRPIFEITLADGGACHAA